MIPLILQGDKSKQLKSIIALLMLSAIFLSVNAWAYKLEVGHGNQAQEWSIGLDGEALISGGTLELRDSVTSDSDQVLLSVLTQNDSSSWEVTVKREDDSWPSGLKLYIKRTGSGNGQGSLADGLDSYLLVETTEKVFFTGESRGKNNIPVQFQLKGLDSIFSLENISASICTKIVYTVKERNPN